MVVEGFLEVQDHVSLTGHIYWPEPWIADLEFVEGLPEDQRALMMEVAAETVERRRGLAAEANAATLAENGLTINELPAEDRDAMAATMNGAIEADIRDKVGSEFHDEFVSNL